MVVAVFPSFFVLLSHYSRAQKLAWDCTWVHLLDWEWKISESLFLWFWKMRMEKFHSRDNLFYHIWYMWSKTLFSVFVSQKQKLFFFHSCHFCQDIQILWSHFLFKWSHFLFMLKKITFSVYVITFSVYVNNFHIFCLC